jgi:FkbM family methyltransferase
MVVKRALAGLAARLGIVRTPARYYGLNELDRKLEAYLDFDRGIFVEAGANDGINQSNTFYFEKHRRWRGLLVEPVPELAERCRQNRPRAIVERCALVPFDRAGESLSMVFTNLTSIVRGAMKTPDDEARHIAAGSAIQNVTPYELEVVGQPLSELLDRHGLQHVDLLSLDVEGFELQALKGIDFTRHRPRFVLVEARYREEIDAYLAPHYRVLDVLSHHDVLYAVREA